LAPVIGGLLFISIFSLQAHIEYRALITNPSDRKAIKGGTTPNVRAITNETPEMAALFI
jgi:hypothetical protein